MLPPKSSHRAKFHRDRSNQLGDRGWSEKKFPHTDTRHPDWLSRASQHARGATKDDVYSLAHQPSTRSSAAYLVSDLDEQVEDDENKQVVNDADSSDDDVDDLE